MKGESLSYITEESNFRKFVSDIPLRTTVSETKNYFSILNQKTNILMNVCCQLSGFQSLKIKGQLTYVDGTPLQISLPYRSIFLSIVNKNSNALLNYCLMTDEIPFINFYGQIELQNQQFHSFDFVCNQTISTEIQNLRTRTEEALLKLGFIKPTKKKAVELKKLQLQLKKKFMNIRKSQDPTYNRSIIQKSSIIKHVNSIQEIDRAKACHELQKTKKGGTFQVEKKNFIITEIQEIPYEMALAEKKIRRQGNKETTYRKIQKEFEIMQRIKNPKHFLQYWKSFGSSHPIYMEYVPKTLKEWIRVGTKPVQQTINIYEQILDSIEQLHRSNVVHRDIKPENFLVKEEMGEQIVKVIDFGESGLIDQPWEKSIVPLGYTLPYSPFQCIYKNEEGVKKTEIDSWSLGFLLFELTYRHWPIYFQNIGKDIVQSWMQGEVFQLCMNFRKKRGILVIQEIISQTVANCLRIKQKQRLTIQKLKSIIQLLKKAIEKVSI